MGTERTEPCESCGKQVPGWDSVFLGGDIGQRLCSGCFNCWTAERMGLQDFEHARFEPLTLTGADGKLHTFHFRTHVGAAGRTLEAFELVDGQPGGYQFGVLGDVEGDAMELFVALYHRVREGLGELSLLQGALGPLLRHPGAVRARIDSDPQAKDWTCQPRVWIDGRVFTWEEFGRMLMTYEGWRFEMQILDRLDVV